jgi:FkbM family methyltransferase
MKTSGRPLLYRLLKKLSFYNHFRDEEYQFKIFDFFRAKGFDFKSEPNEIALEEGNHLIHIRKKGSDFEVLEQVLFKEEYEALVDIIKTNNIQVSTLIDAGANIGLTTIYLKRYFPSLSAICIEPDVNNYNALVKNVKTYSNVTVLNAALWHQKEDLSIDTSFRGGKDWSLSVTADGSGDLVQGLTVSDLIADFGLKTIDILKMDIEGAERFILNEQYNDISFLKLTKVVAIEIHDEFDIRTSIYNLLRSNGFVLLNSGELTIGVNTRFHVEHR